MQREALERANKEGNDVQTRVRQYIVRCQARLNRRAQRPRVDRHGSSVVAESVAGVEDLDGGGELGGQRAIVEVGDVHGVKSISYSLPLSADP